MREERKTRLINTIHALIQTCTCATLSISPAAYAAAPAIFFEISAPLIPGPSALPRPALSAQAQQRSEQPAAWIPVPEWLVGTWTSNKQVVLFSYDHFRNQYSVVEPTAILVDRSSIIGTQKDCTGQTWHYTGSPYVRLVETGRYIERHSIHEITLLEQTARSITLRTQALVSKFDLSNQQLVQELFERTITKYEPLSPGLIQVTYIIDDFDRSGRAAFTSRSVCLQKRITGFRRIDSDERGNLHQMFTDYLKTRR